MLSECQVGTKGWVFRSNQGMGRSACRRVGLAPRVAQLAVDFPGGAEAENFPRAIVEQARDMVEIVLGMDAQVGSFRQVLADEAVGVLVAAALPGAVGVREVDF